MGLMRRLGRGRRQRASVVTIPTRVEAYCFHCRAVREHDFLRWVTSELLPNAASAELRCRTCQDEGHYARPDRPWGVVLVTIGLLLFALPWAVLAGSFARGEAGLPTILRFLAVLALFIFPGSALVLHGWRRFLGDARFGARFPKVEQFHPQFLEVSGIYLILLGIGVFVLNLYAGVANGFEPYAFMATLFAAVLVILGRQLYGKGKSLAGG